MFLTEVAQVLSQLESAPMEFGISREMFEEIVNLVINIRKIYIVAVLGNLQKLLIESLAGEG